MGDLVTLHSLIDTLAARGNKPAIFALREKEIHRWTYPELSNQIERLVNGFTQAGIGNGVCVAMFAENRPEWIAVCLAAIRAGAVVVPIDVQLGEKALGHVLADSEAQFVFTSTTRVKRLESLGPVIKPKLFLLDAGEENKRSWRHLLSDRTTDRPTAEPNDPVLLIYTSGTTGKPKGVPLTHANLVFQLNMLLESGLMGKSDRVLLPLPLHHVYPFVVGMLTPLACGAPMVMPQSLTGPEIIRALREGEITMILGVPRLYRALCAGIEARTESAGRIAVATFKILFSSSLWLRRRTGLRVGKLLLRPVHQQIGPAVRVVASGGAALEPELAWKLEALGWQVAIGYGLTETAPLLTLNPPGKARIGSAGKPVPGVELRIDPSARPDATEGQKRQSPADSARVEGEILARGPNVFSGYRHLPEESRKAFTGGWFRTGDLGYFDEDGYLYITGRASTLLVLEGGKKVQPEDVEEAYQGGAIREIGVLQKGGKLVALVVPKAGAARQDGEEDAAIREAVKDRSKHLPSYQRVSDLAITREPLPRTRLGKIQRHVLAERYDEAVKGKAKHGPAKPGPVAVEELSEEDRALLEIPAAGKVWDWLAERFSDKRLTPDASPQLDLGIDSMEWLNLTLEIGERAGVELTEEAIGRIDTVRDLLQEAARAAEEGAPARPVRPLEKPEEALSDDQKRWLEPLSPLQSALARALLGVNRALMRLLFQLRVKGIEHLPADRQFILAPNHVSYLDPFAIAATLSTRQLLQTHWAGWTGAAFRNWLFRFVSRLGQAVPIDPDRAIVSSLAFCSAVLKRGSNLVWFPEGQRSPDGKLQPFKPGIGMLVEHFDVPVVPVYIHGTHQALPVGKFLPRLRRIVVVFGNPIEAGELKKTAKGEDARTCIANVLHERVGALGRRQNRTLDRQARRWW
jgi:long-chain acyl-CoA synthetase